MSGFGKGIIDHAAEVRMRYVDHYCTAKAHSGEHNSIEVRHWFRRFEVCASCGYVARTR